MKSKNERKQATLQRQRVIEDRRNPIVWHKRKWFWRYRKLRPEQSLFSYEHGELALRRQRYPGWIQENQMMNRFRFQK